MGRPAGDGELPPRAAAVATAAADTLRVFNDLTTMRPAPSNQAWADLADVTAALAALAVLTGRLAPALDQVADAFAHPGTAVDVSAAGDVDVATVRAELAAALAVAGHAADSLEHHLTTARRLATQLRTGRRHRPRTSEP